MRHFVHHFRYDTRKWCSTTGTICIVTIVQNQMIIKHLSSWIIIPKCIDLHHFLAPLKRIPRAFYRKKHVHSTPVKTPNGPPWRSLSPGCEFEFQETETDGRHIGSHGVFRIQSFVTRWQIFDCKKSDGCWNEWVDVYMKMNLSIYKLFYDLYI